MKKSDKKNPVIQCNVTNNANNANNANNDNINSNNLVVAVSALHQQAPAAAVQRF